MKKVENNVTVNLILDTRRAKKNGTYPVKLHVYSNKEKKKYSTGLSVTKEEFRKAWESRKPRGKYRELKEQLEAYYNEVKRIINEEISEFSFKALEKQLFDKEESQDIDIFSLYEDTINQLIRENREGSANIYRCSMNSIKDFIKYKKGKVPSTLAFDSVTTEFLKSWERYNVDVKKNSRAVVGSYARHLRAIFNKAREKELTTSYPFNKRGYRIPSPQSIKKTLSKEQIRVLAEAEPNNYNQAKARDFFILSFCLYGINVKDLALLKNKNLQEDHLSFYRAKTYETSKENAKPIIVPLTPKAKEIIEIYRKPNDDPESYLFNIINDKHKSVRRQTSAFCRFIKQHLYPITKKYNLPSISFQNARHTFATLSIKNGASMEFVQEALGHNNIKTTQSYFAGFDEATGRDIMEKLTDF